MSESTSTTPGLPPHVLWLVPNLGPRLVEAVHVRDGMDLTAPQAIEHLAASDPSPHKHATQWLAEVYLEGGYLWEDLAGGLDSKVADTLGLFAQHRRALDRGARNLEDYRSLADLYRALEPLLPKDSDVDETPGGRELRRIERSRAREQSTILYEGPELRLVVPHTRFAAQWWGRGTRWCTSADGHNMFETYNQSAPLIIALVGQNRYQMWVNDGQIQFMDSADRAMTWQDVENEWAGLQPLVEWACSRVGTTLALVPRWARTPGLCTSAVGADGNALVHVPNESKTYEMCLAAVSRNGDALEHVPSNSRDKAMGQAAMASCPGALPYLPTSMRTAQYCLQAMRHDPYLLNKVPGRMRTRDLYAEVVRADGACLQLLPMDARTLEMCTIAAKSSPMTVGRNGFEVVPLEFRGAIMQIAVEANGSVLNQVPYHLRTPELLATALRSSPQALAAIPSGDKTRELCMQAVQARGTSLRYVPLELVDAPMCRDAIKSDPWALEFVPTELQTVQMCLDAMAGIDPQFEQARPQSFDEIIAKNPKRYGLLPLVAKDNLTREVCTAAIHLNGYSLYWTPRELLTEELVDIGITDQPRTLGSIPVEFRTARVCALAMQGDPARCRLHVPAELAHLYPEPGVETGSLAWTHQTHLAGLVEHLAAWSTSDRVDQARMGLAANDVQATVLPGQGTGMDGPA